MKPRLLLPEANSREISVLTAEHDQHIRSGVCQVLSDHGYRAVGVADGLQALDFVRTSEVDVLLCDVLLPGLPTLELMERAQDRLRSTEIIVMGAASDIETIRKAVHLGARDFITKPFALNAIPITVERNLLRRQIEANRLVEQRNQVLLQCIRALSAAMGARERGTAEHCDRIGPLALMIADALGLSQTQRSTLELAAYVHDIGKIGVRDEILLKPGELSEAEWEKIRTHPGMGGDILSNVEELSDLAHVIRHHHERVDGSGYPDGLSGNQIPLLSRILAVADAFDAMTSDRPYRTRLPESEAVARLLQNAGTQFDPEIVNVFLKALGDLQLRAA